MDVDHDFVPSATDNRLLISLTQEATISEAANLSGVSYPYAVKRIGKLKKKGYLHSRQVGQQFYYSTIRTPETNSLWTITKFNGDNKDEIRFPFYGEMDTFSAHLNRTFQASKKVPIKSLDFLGLIGHTLSVLQVRSFRKYQGEISSQSPDEDDVRSYLNKRVQQLEMEITLAKALLDCRVLWSKSATVWKMINKDEPSAASLARYDRMGKTNE